MIPRGTRVVGWCALAGAALVGCAGAGVPDGPRGTREPSAAACVALPDGARVAARGDVDGDGTPDAVVEVDRGLDVYLARAAGDGGACFTRAGHLALERRAAFVSVAAPASAVDAGAALGDVVVDTWLYHGDRRRTRYHAAGDGRWVEGLGEEIPGPHRPSRPRPPRAR